MIAAGYCMYGSAIDVSALATGILRWPNKDEAVPLYDGFELTHASSFSEGDTTIEVLGVLGEVGRHADSHLVALPGAPRRSWS
jgi:hypothetical protein